MYAIDTMAGFSPVPLSLHASEAIRRLMQEAAIDMSVVDGYTAMYQRGESPLQEQP
jgi:hypothetical protein